MPLSAITVVVVTIGSAVTVVNSEVVEIKVSVSVAVV